MYHTLDDFLQDWVFESESTLHLFKNLTDGSLKFKPNDNVRSAGRLAWHITLSMSEMISRTGLSIGTIDRNEPVPEQAERIYLTYADLSAALTAAVRQQWNDDSLDEEISMFGENWQKRKVLASLIKHQIHHRGQLTIVMRQAGLKVAGVYGPSFEEWASMGMKPME